MQHRVLRSELDQSLRAVIGSEHIDKLIDDADDPDYVVIITEDRIETRLAGVTHAARIGAL